MVDVVRDIAVDPDFPIEPGNPLRQVIVTTHSPVFVQGQRKSDLVVAVSGLMTRDGRPAHTVEVLPMAGTWRESMAPLALSESDVSAYLAIDPNNQLAVDLAPSGVDS
jgi:hypothetical protein